MKFKRVLSANHIAQSFKTSDTKEETDLKQEGWYKSLTEETNGADIKTVEDWKRSNKRLQDSHQTNDKNLFSPHSLSFVPSHLFHLEQTPIAAGF